MKLIPAIDLMDSMPVRLAQGDFDRRTDYGSTADDALAAFKAQGAELTHIVDLDGARAGEPRQHELIASLAPIMPIQVAGGFRTREQVGDMFEAGAARVVIGSLALKKPQAFVEMLNCYGAERMVLALDVAIQDGAPVVASHGWQESSGRSLDDVLADFPRVRHILVTDISRDGMMSGPNVELYRLLKAQYPDIVVQASGGVASLDDLDELRAAGADAAITGKAIWGKTFSVADGVKRARG
ncbi:HisA/HisF-related TIM barrel protein [Sphingomicrobium clamense]|uniref:1-(5-phosphoribosyl)-5-[(5-phosphoribosylamino)methylideneamino] imidazole-4-carboxamide isomerase n=1 Tax=Sphingomicrobium clamense TaxID=2851013 RepID=A0ABS6V351_9SPHN|nr:1-(5-phosphoribosyl)-5-[(5-phosphoribosylamino)methylideneamino] imidazole-4-carboxamide isomerase [Sphingomicrobium sp. B8]MBW0143984.1 1-(5-phosphoribosyl)-5-[(5-phosphoribosylamino)methylideneamino] imidazole-4-carboxamide isomerase [Sphingomicrobium sp. B8]